MCMNVFFFFFSKNDSAYPECLIYGFIRVVFIDVTVILRSTQRSVKMVGYHRKYAKATDM